MTNTPDQNEPPPERPHYRWPWFVLGAFVLAVILAVLWMSAEVRRQTQYRKLNTTQFPQVNSGTNSAK